MATATQKRIRLSLDLSLVAQRRLSKAAAQRDLSVQQYVLDAVQQRLREDLGTASERESLFALNAQTDPVLAELWDNAQDAADDRL
jgi:hypothetical protein